MLKTRNLLDQQDVVEGEGLEDHHQEVHQEDHHQEDHHLVETCHQGVVHHPGEDPHHQLHAEDPCHQRGMVLTMVMTDMIGPLLIVDLLLLIAVDTLPQGIMIVDMNENESVHLVMVVSEDTLTSTLPQKGDILAVIVAMDPLVVIGMTVLLEGMEVNEATLNDTAAAVVVAIDTLLVTMAMAVIVAMKEVAMELAVIEGMVHLTSVQAMVHLLLLVAIRQEVSMQLKIGSVP